MPSHKRPFPAAVLLLFAAGLSGGCQDLDVELAEEIVFACDSNKRCPQPGHTCDLEGLCRPSTAQSFAELFSPSDAPALAKPSASRASAANGAGSTARTATSASRERRSGHDCAERCARKQAECTAQCEERMTCRQHCGRSTDICYARCHRADDARAMARQRRNEKHCMRGQGGMRRCSPAEGQELRAEMAQASKLYCRDRNGENALCHEQRQQLERSRRFISKDCTGAGCMGASRD